MPSATIRTYSQYDINGSTVSVSKITCEDSQVANIQKEVSFGKFSKKLHLRNKTVETNLDSDLCR
ncbi:MAG: hypothetical protein IJ318_03320 [Clostridia bacterium]|nr:hypothetical protein [Clostridia bacterium]